MLLHYMFTAYMLGRNKGILYCNVCHQESVALLTSKLRLLDPAQLGDVELRLQVLATKLDKLNKMKGSAQEAEKLSKVGENYNLLLSSYIYFTYLFL